MRLFERKYDCESIKAPRITPNTATARHRCVKIIIFGSSPMKRILANHGRLSHGIARELRKQVAILEQEIEELE